MRESTRTGSDARRAPKRGYHIQWAKLPVSNEGAENPFYVTTSLMVPSVFVVAFSHAM
jgi:hypothetical protein